ncbi:translation initiation factor IF-3 [Nautilia profundicola AmH]|uniref:Translation initiation factor IF-3 n=1 Tax=Nautilia profundicola (strain ATCC BAA-1463 / DSM 18972 / AmH) TaxID=598659 RepID=IF3_NAUPA|nr:translation initiation factor IF-3 [Nautilia profundicola]B9L5U8.1 RecName: Full=Translation initiation factor IF-3 [Nautilia profundicola AmH]ACM92808.1 translation initiation factor IF-3 [Nautilia profundicola AmH]
MSKKEEKVLINEEIVDLTDRVRLVDGEGEPKIVDSSKALEIAYNKGLDLVLVAPNANPPVAKVMDYGKYKYEQEKKKKEAKKKQVKIEVKEIKFTSKIQENDINYKVKHIKEFLEKGKHVKLRVFLRGRELATPEKGFEVINKVWDMISDVAEKQNEPKLEGNYINLLVTPIKKKIKK